MKGTVALLEFDGFHLKHNNVINFLHGISGSEVYRGMQIALKPINSRYTALPNQVFKGINFKY